jgi:hypothetical protein
MRLNQQGDLRRPLKLDEQMDFIFRKYCLDIQLKVESKRILGNISQDLIKTFDVLMVFAPHIT